MRRDEPRDCHREPEGRVGKTTTAINLAAALAAFDRKRPAHRHGPPGQRDLGPGLRQTRTRPDDLRGLISGDASRGVRATASRTSRSSPPAGTSSGRRSSWWTSRSRGPAPVRLGYVRESVRPIFIDCPSVAVAPDRQRLGRGGLSPRTDADRVLRPGGGDASFSRRSGASADAFNPLLEDRRDRVDDVRRAHQPRPTGRRRHPRAFGEKVFDTVIPRNIRLGEAPSFGKTVLAYDIKSKGAEAYIELGPGVPARNGGRTPSGKKPVLGRGLSALLPGKEDVPVERIRARSRSIGSSFPVPAASGVFRGIPQGACQLDPRAGDRSTDRRRVAGENGSRSWPGSDAGALPASPGWRGFR